MKQMSKNLLWGLLFFLPTQMVWSTEHKITFQEVNLQESSLKIKWWVEGLERGNNQAINKMELILDEKLESPERITSTSLEPDRGGGICYLVMSDNSGSMKPFLPDLKVLIKSLLLYKNDKDSLGLVLFSKDWKELKAITQDKINKRELSSLLTKITTRGKRTELLRFAKKGVTSLVSSCDKNMYRKVLIILSDGDAEDEKYTITPAIETARKHKVSIYAFGYRKTGANFLSYLSRLAEDTGGMLVFPKKHKKNEYKVVENLYSDSNSGGELSARLSTEPKKSLKLKLTLSNGNTIIEDIPITIKNTSKSEIFVVLSSLEKDIINWIPGVDSTDELRQILSILGALLLISLILLLLRMRGTSASNTSRDIKGYLVHLNEPYPVHTGINSVGFLPDNDIQIDDDTVGRAHATIHYQGEGDVVLTDLDSLNGSWVNGDRIEQATSIQNGDMINFGNWQAVFQRAEPEHQED